MNVTVTNHKGGCGKSTTAVHVAAYVARKLGEGSVVLVDTDPNGSALEWAARAGGGGVGGGGGGGGEGAAVQGRGARGGGAGGARRLRLAGEVARRGPRGRG